MYRQPFSGDYPITQKFGEVIPGVTYKNEPHTGIDYACPFGTNILATEEGYIFFSGWNPSGYGNMVMIRHADGNASLYAHLSTIRVHVGQSVRQGEKIGESGSTGNSTGAHLHFEMRDAYGNPFDPMTILQNVVDMDKTDIPKPVYKTLKNADAFEEGDTVKVVAPLGCKAFFRGFDDRTVYPQGQRFYYTGKTEERNGYTYMEVIPLSIPVWVAVHDFDTQILDK